MGGSVVAVLVAALGLVVTAFWFGVSRRRQAEAEIGIQAMANLKWRDCIAVILEALQLDGYRRAANSTANSESEILLDQRGTSVLLGFKHGTAYRLSEANVRDFAHAVGMRGARSGILLTLGTVEGSAARGLAASSGIELIDRNALWHKTREFMPAEVLHHVRGEASRRIGKGLWAGSLASLLAGVAAYAITSLPAPSATAQATGAARSAPPAVGMPARSPTAATVVSAQDPVLAQLNATAKAMADVARLSPEQLARRRAEAAKQVSSIPQVETAVWSAQRTLLLSLSRTDGKDKVLIEEACRILIQNEELRFTRIQLNPPSGSGLAVRWRLCE